MESAWKSKLKEYAIEESGLKVMLKDVAVSTENEDCAKLKKSFSAWLKLFFGKTNPNVEQSFVTFDQLVQIR